MSLIEINHIKKGFSHYDLLKDIHFDITENQIIGIVGHNGCGKTTLLNILAGNESIDEGTIIKHKKNMTINYLPQSMHYNQQELKHIFQQINQEMLETMSHIGMNKIPETTSLSGGEKTKLAITKLLSKKSDLILLDEPTNHLDYIGMNWLIKTLKEQSITAVIVSHDRYFLDEVVDIIIEIEEGNSTLFKGNYSFYKKEKQRIIESAQHRYSEQKKVEAKIDQEISNLDNWSHKAHRDAPKVAKKHRIRKGAKEFYRTKAKKRDKQIKSKRKQLEKLRQTITKPTEEQQIQFTLSNNGKQGKRILEANQLTKKINDKLLFHNSDFLIARGDKVGLIGLNGCGKTTLIRMILGLDQDYKGKLWVSHSLKIGYISQDVLDLREDRLLINKIQQYDLNTQTKIRQLLDQVGIKKTHLKHPLNTFSLGELMRIKLVFLIIEDYDVLILDEPTNHLDLLTREQLEETLVTYRGTLLIASHDRYLLNRITAKLLLFDKQTITRLELGYKDLNLKKELNSDIKKQLMVIEYEIAFVISQLSQYTDKDPQYHALDLRFNELLNKKQKLM